jgi:tyrosine-protein kinase Etk/Wzc
MKKIQVSKDSGIETTEDSPVRQLLFRYLPYWPFFLTLLFIGLFSAFFYLKTIVPVFEISASILIKDQRKGTDESKIMESLDLIGAKKIVENEIDVIRSRSILSEVIKNQHLYAPIYEKDRFLSRPAFISSPIFIELQLPDSLTHTKNIAFEFLQGKIKIDNRFYQLNTWIQSNWGTIRFSHNPNWNGLISKSLSYYFDLNDVKMAVNELSDKLDVSASGKLSSVINLTLKDEVPERGEEILNGIISVYNTVSMTEKNRLATNTLDFIEKRLSNMGLQLDSVETGIQKFRTEKDVVDISAQGKQYLASVGESDQKLSEVNMQLAVLDEVEKYVESKSDETGIVPSTFGISDKLLSQLIEKLFNSEIQYEGLRKTTAKNNPILVSLRNEIEKMKPTILENIKNQKASLLAGRENLSQTSNKYSSLLRSIPLKERQLVEVSRQQAIKNNIYTFLLQKREEIALSLNSTVPDSRIIDKAESSLLPISPKKHSVYAIAVLLSLGFGILWIGSKEIFNSKIQFRTDVENLTMIPVIGELVFNKTKQPNVFSDGDKTLIAEQFRFLRSAVSRSGTNKIKRIMITSSITGEGKSFVASNLATSIALAGKKVVLVDLDLHKPGIHGFFNLTNDRGVTDFLNGKLELNELMIQSNEIENLYIIPAGEAPTNPSELLLNGKLKSLMNTLDNICDVMIFDTAPALAITDAYIIGSRCDANLYIIRHDYTPKIQVQLLDENTGMYKMKNIGIVFNGVKKRGMGRYGFGYGYGYNFDYGYGAVERKSL